MDHGAAPGGATGTGEPGADQGRGDPPLGHPESARRAQGLRLPGRVHRRVHLGGLPRGDRPRHATAAAAAVPVRVGHQTWASRRFVATGEHGESEAALRHVRRHFITRGNLRRAIAKLVNATLAARDPAWWGTGSVCASDSKKRFIGQARRRSEGSAFRVVGVEPDDRIPPALPGPA